MKRILAAVLCCAICMSLCSCNRKLTLRSKMTTPATNANALPSVSTTAPMKVEQIVPGEALIHGCTVEIYHVFYTYVDSGGKKNACSVSVRMKNNSGKAVSLNSICTIRVKQNSRTCTKVNSPMGDMLTQPDEKVESGSWGTYNFYYVISSLNKPVQVQLLYQGSVLTEITYPS